MRAHPRNAAVDPSAPRAWGTCDQCGFIWSHYKLAWRHEWAGTRLVNLQLLVCPTCLDEPQPQFRTFILPPDPEPLFNARPEQYSIDEVPVSSRVTMAGGFRVTLNYPRNSLRIISGDTSA